MSRDVAQTEHNCPEEKEKLITCPRAREKLNASWNVAKTKHMPREKREIIRLTKSKGESTHDRVQSSSVG